MTTKQQTFTASGTFTAPPSMLNGSVSLDVRGGVGTVGHEAGSVKAVAGKGARVTGAVALAPGATLIISINHHPGGVGGVGTRAGGAGGGSAAVLSGTTVLIEAGGGGGTGGNPGWTPSTGGTGGQTGKAGVPLQEGRQYAPRANAGGGATPTTPGAGGTAVTGLGGLSGAAGTATAGGAGAETTATGGGGGGGGGGGREGGGGGASSINGGAGGGGGSSYASPGVTGPAFTTGYQSSGPTVVVTYVVADPPKVPTLVSPANGSYADVGTLTFVYNPGTNSGPISKFAVRRRLGTTPFEWWTATAHDWVTTPTDPVPQLTADLLEFVAGNEWSYTFPAGAWATGDVYAYSVATWEGSRGLGGTFAPTVVFTNATPTHLTVTGPVSPASTSTPVVTWTSSDLQTGYHVKIFEKATTEETGFTPAVSGGAVYDSGTVDSTTHDVVVPSSSALATGQTFVVYVMVTSGGTASRWKSRSFTVTLDAPVTPTLTANRTETATSGMPTVLLGVTTADNKLTATEASFEGGIGSWAAATPADWTLKQTDAWHADGAYSMAIKCKTASTLTATATSAKPITPGETVTLMATIRAPGTTRTWKLVAVFEKATGSVIESVTVATGNDSATGVTLKGHTVAPATATQVKVRLRSAGPWAATEIHQVDKVALFPGAVTTWSAGGFVGASTVQVQASTDTGATWSTMLVAGSSAMGVNPQQAHIADVASPNGVATRSYRVRTVSTADNVTVVSAWSAVAAGLELPNARWWIVDVTDPTTAIGLSRAQSMSTTVYGTTGRPSYVENRKANAGIFTCLGRQTVVKVTDVVMLPDFTLVMDFFGQDQFDAFMVLWLANQETGKTMLVKSDQPGVVYWVTFGPTRPVPVLRAADRKTNPVRQANVHCYPATPVTA